jgi:hypothetical protein
MSRTKPTTTTAREASRLAQLLAATTPGADGTIAAHARRHFDRVRGSSLAKGGASRAEGPAGSIAGGASGRSYLHDGPTRSAVLNAFVQELGWPGLVPADATVLDEHELAPRLFERARRYIVRQLMITGRTDMALTLAPLLKPGPNERAARLYLRAAARSGGALGAIARDYEEQRRRSGAAEEDDRRASCIMAAFAARCLAYAEGQLGSHVRDEVRRAVSELVSEGKAPVRRRRASAPRAQGGSVDAEDPRELRRARSR